jgi:hypothetical protein
VVGVLVWVGVAVRAGAEVRSGPLGGGALCSPAGIGLVLWVVLSAVPLRKVSRDAGGPQ